MSGWVDSQGFWHNAPECNSGTVTNDESGFIRIDPAHNLTCRTRESEAALQSELTDLRALVGELAEGEWTHWDSNDDRVCSLCQGEVWDDKKLHHFSDCLWLRAQKWKHVHS